MTGRTARLRSFAVLLLVPLAVLLFACLFVLLVGLWSANKLPMDAIPDITGVQVQVNTTVPALAPDEVEKLVTVPLEMALGERKRGREAGDAAAHDHHVSRPMRTAGHCRSEGRSRVQTIGHHLHRSRQPSD